MSYFSGVFIGASAAAARQQRSALLTQALVAALLDERVADISGCLPELAMLGGGGGALTIARVWQALQEGDDAAAEQLAAAAIRAGMATLALAAMNRLLLARIALRRGDAASAAEHVASAYAQANTQLTPAVIAAYVLRHGLPSEAPAAEEASGLERR